MKAIGTNGAYIPNKELDLVHAALFYYTNMMKENGDDKVYPSLYKNAMKLWQTSGDILQVIDELC